MFRPGSRYHQARLFTAAAGAPAPFPGVRPREIGPAPGIIEHTVRAGDRLDLLARHYYNDDRLWWRIADANPAFFFGGDLVQEKTLVVDDEGGLRAQDSPEPGAQVVAASMLGRVILIPKARE